MSVIAADAVVRRAPDVVWRVTSGAVRVRRIGDRTDRAAADLTGPAARLWLIAEEPTPISQLVDEIGSDEDQVLELAATLTEIGWLVEVSAS